MGNNFIDSADITVVVQGKNVKGQTKKCFDSIRTYLPKAKIVFSTYKNEDVKNLDYDVLVESEDPGATLLFDKMYNNINRILLTTKAGLEFANTKYCIKMRSDLIFANNKLLQNIVSLFPKRNPKYSIFKERVVFYSLFSRKSEYVANRFYVLTPFHLSDWFCFGLTEDIKKYFADCPYTKEPDFSIHFKNPKNRLMGYCDSNVMWKFPPEQWFCSNFFKKYFKKADMLNSQDFSDELMRVSDEILANNVLIVGYNEIGVYIQKKEYKKISLTTHKRRYCNWLSGINTYEKFLKDYKKYCDSNFVIPLKYTWQDDLNISLLVYKFWRQWRKFAVPFKLIVNSFYGICGMFYYFANILINIFRFLPNLLLKIRRRNGD